MQGNTSGVRIGSVGGNIEGSVIAGGDVSHVSLGGGEEHSLDQMRVLLQEIERELTALAGQPALLGRVSPAAGAMVEGSIAAVADAATHCKAPSGLATVRQRVSEGLMLVTSVLQGAKAVAKSADEAGDAIAPLAEKAQSLIDKLGTVTAWVAKLSLPLAAGGL